METAPVEEYSVLLLEESDMLSDLFDSWLPEIPTRTVPSVDALETRLDASVTVACLCQTALGDAEEKVRKQLLSTNPYCQLVLVVPRGTAFTAPFDDQYDACLTRPLFKDDLRTTVKQRLKCGVYSALLREFYHLNATLSWVQRTEDTKAASDINQERVRNRYHTRRSQLQQLQTELDDETIHEIVRSIDLHKRYLREPAVGETETKQSKYHPPRCPQCKLDWGINHGNELQAGFDRISAYVWKCLKCHNIVHGVGESHRRVAPN